MNQAILIGRLTSEPDVRYSADGKAYARYTLAVDRPTKGEQTADFINCVCFGNSAEFAEKYLRKGTKIAVVGRIQTGSYTNKEGVKVYTTDVLVNNQEFVESKSAQHQAETTPEPVPERSPANDTGFMKIPDGIDDELPFI